MKTVAILQSNYIPWRGYFDLIRRVDEFIIYDEVQYTQHDWRNRNRIKAVNGSQWLTIPVAVNGKFHQKIRDAKVIDPAGWGPRHLKTLAYNYGKAPHFADYRDAFASIYNEGKEEYLSRINLSFIRLICSFLGIATPITSSDDYPHGEEGKTSKLIEILKGARATEYVSGPAAKDYIEEQLFVDAGIKLTWMDYAGYPPYSQLYPPVFDPYVSVVDLLFNEGPGSPHFIWGWRYEVDHA